MRLNPTSVGSHPSSRRRIDDSVDTPSRGSYRRYTFEEGVAKNRKTSAVDNDKTLRASDFFRQESFLHRDNQLSDRVSRIAKFCNARIDLSPPTLSRPNSFPSFLTYSFKASPPPFFASPSPNLRSPSSPFVSLFSLLRFQSCLENPDTLDH